MISNSATNTSWSTARVWTNGCTRTDPRGPKSSRASVRLHNVERYRRPDFDHLNFETTIDDPRNIYSKKK
jgi:hypothetical protein